MFVDITGYEGRYKVSKSGEVVCVFRRGREGWWPLAPVDTGKGYLAVTLVNGARSTSRRFYIHRLVALAFLPNKSPENLQVNHINGNKADNRAVNLEWATCSDNNAHAHANGLNRTFGAMSMRGVIGTSVTTGETVRFDSIGAARRAGFHDASISACCKGKRATHSGYAWRYAIPSAETHVSRGMLAPDETRTNPECAGAGHG